MQVLIINKGENFPKIPKNFHKIIKNLPTLRALDGVGSRVHQ